MDSSPRRKADQCLLIINRQIRIFADGLLPSKLVNIDVPASIDVLLLSRSLLRLFRSHSGGSKEWVFNSGCKRLWCSVWQSRLFFPTSPHLL